MRDVIFTSAARFEIFEAQDWYGNESSSFGRRFFLELDAVLVRIEANPRQFPVVYKNVRRALLKRFPYAVMFVLDLDENITVISCFHGSRDPLRWQERV